MRRAVVVAGAALAVALVSGMVGVALAVMTICSGDGPEFPY